jgi:hypothetical protein
MSDEPDVNEIRRHLKWLVAVIVVVLVLLVGLTLYLYAHFTSGVKVTPS